jgi:CheY-like chemotaxis protein/ribosomal protein L40E
MLSVLTKDSEGAPDSPVARRILVAEDSPTTHEILKLLLSQRGHHVDIATDGEQALEALRQNTYDVALLDFHLPKMDGLQVATITRQEAADRKVPKLIAITLDAEGLLAHPEGCHNFDHVLPKPLDIYQVARVVEDQADIADMESEEPAPSADKPAARPVAPSPLENLGHNFLTWPGDIQAGRLSARAVQASLADPRFDGILVKDPVSVEELGAIWRAKALYTLPLVDATGTLGCIADIDASKLTARDTTFLDQVLGKAHDRRLKLHRDLRFSEDLGEQLIGRLFVMDRPLLPTYDPHSKWQVTYNVPLTTAVIMREAEALCEHGFLRREFFDRFHVCPQCDSHRLHVREECRKCHSSQLEEEQYLHHFRCAYQGPESDFRRGDRLVCPKCRYELTHFGYDYDRPGSMVACEACGNAASEPAVGFVCLDCGGHVDADVAPPRDLYSYYLTDQGIGFAELGHSLLGTATHALRFADLPLELVVALNGAAKRYNETKEPFTLISIYYRNERDIVAEHGAKTFAKVRDLFLENLRTVLRGDADLVVSGHSRDFVLLAGSEPEETSADFDLLVAGAEKTLRCDLGPSFQVFGPGDFA